MSISCCKIIAEEVAIMMTLRGELTKERGLYAQRAREEDEPGNTAARGMDVPKSMDGTMRALEGERR